LGLIATCRPIDTDSVVAREPPLVIWPSRRLGFADTGHHVTFENAPLTEKQ
jgi:hypothetical protein